MVDYEVLQLLVPTLLSGCLVGVFLNAVSPDWLICIFLIGTLALLKKKIDLLVQKYEYWCLVGV